MIINFSLHDVMVAVCSLILLVAIVPTVLAKTILPKTTTLLTMAALWGLTATFLTMGLVYATIVQGLSAACWTYLYKLSKNNNELSN